VGSRKRMSWRVSNSMTADFCVEALQEALAKYGKPEIVNTDQGSHSPPWNSGMLAMAFRTCALMSQLARWRSHTAAAYVRQLW
jgi:putative transposase